MQLTRHYPSRRHQSHQTLDACSSRLPNRRTHSNPSLSCPAATSPVRLLNRIVPCISTVESALWIRIAGFYSPSACLIPPSFMHLRLSARRSSAGSIASQSGPIPEFAKAAMSRASCRLPRKSYRMPPSASSTITPEARYCFFFCGINHHSRGYFSVTTNYATNPSPTESLPFRKRGRIARESRRIRILRIPSPSRIHAAAASEIECRFDNGHLWSLLPVQIGIW
jgi:hypothetical protein